MEFFLIIKILAFHEIFSGNIYPNKLCREGEDEVIVLLLTERTGTTWNSRAGVAEIGQCVTDQPLCFMKIVFIIVLDGRQYNRSYNYSNSVCTNTNRWSCHFFAFYLVNVESARTGGLGVELVGSISSSRGAHTASSKLNKFHHSLAQQIADTRADAHSAYESREHFRGCSLFNICTSAYSSDYLRMLHRVFRSWTVYNVFLLPFIRLTNFYFHQIAHSNKTSQNKCVSKQTILPVLAATNSFKKNNNTFTTKHYTEDNNKNCNELQKQPFSYKAFIELKIN